MTTTPTELNQTLIDRAYAAFADGDMPAVLSVLAPEITWHVPGRSPLSGDFLGHDGVLDFFTRCHKLSQGTLRVVPEKIFGAGDHVVALTTVSAERNGQAGRHPRSTSGALSTAEPSSSSSTKVTSNPRTSSGSPELWRRRKLPRQHHRRTG